MGATEKSTDRKKPGPAPLDPADRRVGRPIYLKPREWAQVKRDAKRAKLPLQDWMRGRLGVG